MPTVIAHRYAARGFPIVRLAVAREAAFDLELMRNEHLADRGASARRVIGRALNHGANVVAAQWRVAQRITNS
jgi:hypothetical protein